jgi:hypothetical protein
MYQDCSSLDLIEKGPDSQSTYDIERSRKRKDYFTGCLPWPQKGTASFIADTGNLAVKSTRDIIIGRVTRIILLSIETLPIVPN